jgi:hypothetical protein
MTEAAVWTETLSGEGRLIADAGTLGAGEGLCRDALGTLHVEEQTGVAGNGAFAGVPEPEIANLVQSFWQDVLKEAAHELLALEGADAPAVGLAVLVAERDGVLVEADDARVGNGNAKDITREIPEHGLFALAPRGDPDDPERGPGAVRDDEVGALLGKVSLELAAHELGDRDLRVKDARE